MAVLASWSLVSRSRWTSQYHSRLIAFDSSSDVKKCR